METSDVNKATTAAEQSFPQEKKKSRRGLGSRKKAAEKYRTHKNETKGAQFIADRIAKFHLTNGIVPEELFGPMCTSLNVTKPVQEIFISTHTLADVARETVETLVQACKVPTVNVEEDIETVQLVASLQLETKLHYARSNTPYATANFAEDTQAERVVNNASQTILPIAIMIDQIGQVEVDGQQFVPGEEVDDNGELKSFSFNRLNDQNLYNRDKYRFLRRGLYTLDGIQYQARGRLVPMNRMGINGGHIHIDILNFDRALQQGLIDAHGVLNPNLGINVHPLPEDAQFIELLERDGIPPLDVLFHRYVNFMARVQKKVAPDKLPFLHLNKAVGTSSQLVMSGPFDPNGFREVWCSRLVTNDALFIGAAFELNVIPQPLTDYNACLIRASVDSRNAIHRLMQVLSKRVER